MKKISLKNNKNNWSDSEHTQSLQNRNNERFRMTENLFTLSDGSEIGRARRVEDPVPMCRQTTLCRNVQFQDRGQGEGWHWQKALKTAALTLALSFFIAAPAMANNTPPVPTLDNLQGQTIPGTDPAQTYPESAYKLVPVENADPDNLPENTITLYDKETVIKYYDPTTGAEVAASDRVEGVEYKEVTTIQTTPKCYTVELKQTEYGNSTATGETKTFTVSTPNPQGTGNAFKYEVTYKVDDSRLAPGRITTDQSGNPVNNDFVGFKNEVTGDYAYGGAIYNNSTTIGNITGDFVGNVVSSDDSTAYGGGVYNSGTNAVIGDIISNFISNSAQSTTSATYGGAIYNSGSSYTTIGNITGNFIGNYAESQSAARGGAIYNGGYRASISDINANFIGNYASSQTSTALGGAIHNNNRADIDNITGDFIGNYAIALEGSASGGAISNNGSAILDVAGDFIGNFAYSENNEAYGGAISNSSYYQNYSQYSGEIANITGNFIENYVASKTGSVSGGAIYNNRCDIGNVVGNFIKNYAVTIEGEAVGGAIYTSNSSDRSYSIGTVTGDFIENYASSTEKDAKGGAIYNDQMINGGISGDFIGNYVKSEKKHVYGGAIYNDRNDDSTRNELPYITGNFIGNYAQTTDGHAYGGAIYNDLATIESVTGDFINNSAVAVGDKAEGGAINNNDSAFINELKGDFIGNYVKSTEKHAFGGAVYNDQGDRYSQGGIPVLEGDFIANYAISDNEKAFGGGLYTDGLVSDLKGDFAANYVQTDSGKAQGGAIYVDNEGEVTKMVSDFVGNYAIGNSGDANGGAIYNNSVINVNGSKFLNNYTTSQSGNAYGGAIYNLVDASVLKLTVNVYDEDDEDVLVESLGSWYFKERPDSLTVENAIFEGNKVSSVSGNAYGGAIYNNDRIYTHEKEESYTSSYSAEDAAEEYDKTGADSPDGMITDTDRQVTVIKNSSFINNTATSQQGKAKGGAIYTSGNMDIVADNFDSIFSGNKANNTPEAIYVDNSKYWSDPTTLTLKTENKGKIIFDDGINGTSEGYNLAITGDDSGEIYFNNTIKNANITIDNTNVYINDGANLAGSKSLALNSGVLNIAHFANQAVNLDRFSNSTQITIGSVDVDLQKETMGRITAKEYGDVSGSIDVQGVNLLNDSKKEITNVLFADKEIASNVAYTGISPVAYSPIYKYEVSYNPDDGFFTFARSGGPSGSGGNASDAYNPAVLTSPVTTQAGAYATQMQTFNYAFQHADNFMMFPSIERTAFKSENKYAMAPNTGVFSPLMTPSYQNNIWVKPYASFESIPLKNGPKVSNINYGTLVGFDSKLETLTNGFERILTGYIGYNGSSQRYQGVDAYQNGGLLGGTATFYKGNFFNATTLSVGASAGDANTMYGSENYTMLLAGVGNKTGYNFEFKDGKFIFQPAMLLSYSFVNTFDYTNAAGVRINSDPLHAIQLSPGLKFIMNTENGWQPYLAVDMTWNILDETRVTANSVRLPDMSIKPYVSYGAGVQKRFKDDKYTAFGQTMVHNGGRRGVSLTFGLRWKVGK